MLEAPRRNGFHANPAKKAWNGNGPDARILHRGRPLPCWEVSSLLELSNPGELLKPFLNGGLAAEES